MKIVPSPRILSMLGEIEIAEWQCLAELLDNAADEIAQRNDSVTQSTEELAKLSCIEVLLPTEKATRETAEVEVRDHGRGMTQDQLQQAVKAGWSGNNPFDRLGLFGMGFNVATARLGRVAEILTTREGEDQWRGVRIDLDKVGDDFEVPDIREPKDDPSVHGTKVRITRLDPDRFRFLSQKHEFIRAKLGHVYSWLLEHTPVSIRVNGRVVNPRRHCVWDESRAVIHGRGAKTEEIPAVIRIDHDLPDAEACGDCGHWQNPGMGVCDVCAGKNLKYRKRRIHGWVGVQRFLSTDQYGIDFIRNGRKILMSDKSVFEWTDINDPTGTVITEYPIELPANSGRIVGEVHLDHVPVDYKKDRFETSSREWRSAMSLLRGDGPLRPQTATKRGYEARNSSPIGRVFRGYQRNDAGKKCLIPGDGERATHTQAAQWGTYFARGDREYQTDQKWWEGVVYHDSIKDQKNLPEKSDSGQVDDEAVLAALGTTPTPLLRQNPTDGTGSSPVEDDGSSVTSPEPSKKPLTLEERASRLKQEAKAIPALTREYRINSINGRLDVSAWSTATGAIVDPSRPRRVAPIWLHPTGGGTADLFLDQTHGVFTRSGAEELDLVAADVAHFIGIQRSVMSSMQLSELIAELRADTFTDANVDFSTVQDAARNIIDEVRERATESVSENPERAWKVLTPPEIAQVEANFSNQREMPTSDSPAFIEFVPAMYLVRLFDEWPEAFTDGRVFDDHYEPLMPESRSLVKARLSSLLLDCASIATQEKEVTVPNTLKRARLSIEIMGQKLAES